ncbi:MULTISPECIES: carbohydrate-binding family 9-like protein [unclassified Bacteroides]|uniref:carbohydrate-binding family 9-like protein n=1 Tax=unclassified Bacteroides TaxID=2646097 RepID=UPI004063F17E
MYLKKYLSLTVAALCVLSLSAITPQKNRMKELSVKKVSAANVPVESLPALLDKEKVDFQPVNTVNWTAFPYRPDVEFRIAYTQDAILLHFKVREESVRAVAGHDNGPVWEDACVEFFSVPADDGVYYNVECNCVGTLLVGAGAGRKNRRHAPQEVMDKVQRWSSLGSEGFGERVGDCCWEVALVIPYTTFFLHRITSLEGKAIRANFYKCGDKLRTPHFLSWSPIGLEKPDFHCPEFFGVLKME